MVSIGGSESVLKLSLIITGVCQWFHSLQCDFINSHMHGSGPAASRLMDDSGEPGWRRLRPRAAPPPSLVRQGLLKARSRPYRQAPCWHFGCLSFSAIYGHSVMCELGLCGVWKHFFCPLRWILLLFCSLSNKQQATFLTSVWAPTEWHAVMSRDLFVGEFSLIFHRNRNSPDEPQKFTVLEFVEMILLFYELGHWGIDRARTRSWNLSFLIQRFSRQSANPRLWSVPVRSLY